LLISTGGLDVEVAEIILFVLMTFLIEFTRRYCDFDVVLPGTGANLSVSPNVVCYLLIAIAPIFYFYRFLRIISI
jgi:hypothetical protein